jgi:hypothetical protein
MRMDSIRGFLGRAWRAMTTSRYTEMLERENFRLREDNRRLMDAMLATAGIGPVFGERLETPRASRRMTLHQQQAESERKTAERQRAIERAAASADAGGENQCSE